MVLVNSADVAGDLFEKRSSIYSERCNFPMMNDLCVRPWSAAQTPVQCVHQGGTRLGLIVHALRRALAPAPQGVLSTLSSCCLCHVSSHPGQTDTVSLFASICCAVRHPTTVSSDLIRRLHESPEIFIGHLRHLADFIIMEVKKKGQRF
jgi:hypothetical protein